MPLEDKEKVDLVYKGTVDLVYKVARWHQVMPCVDR